MASIIKSISFKNFYNFFGDYADNNYDFTEGINIVNADNGMGKSKIYNGILWLLKGQVYDSDSRSIANVDDAVALKMLSDKAKLTEQAPELGVKIIFEDSTNKYEIEKTISFVKKRVDASTSDKGHWNIGTQNLKVNEVNLNSGSLKCVYDIDTQNDIIANRLISKELQPYALLQGEAIDNIVDLSNSDKLSATVEVLTNIDELKSINLASQRLFKLADKDLSERQRMSANNHAQVQKLLTDKDKYIRIVDECDESIVIYKSELKKATDLKEKLHSVIANAEKRAEFRGKLERVEKDLKTAHDEKVIFLSGINDNLFKRRSPWLLIGTNGSIEKFSALSDEYKEKRREREILKNPGEFFSVLPEGSPDDISLNKMIEQGKCYVCGRDAKQHSEPWVHMVNVRDRSVNIRKDKVSSGLTGFFSDIQKNIQGYSNVDFIFSDIAEARKVIREIDAKISNLNRDRTAILTEYINYGGKSGDLTGDADINTLNSYSKAHDDIKKNESLIKEAGIRKDSFKTQIIETEKKLKEAVGSDIPDVFESLKEILEDVNKIFTNTKERIYDSVISNLESKSNEYYRALTDGNKFIGGNLKFTKTDYDSISIEVLTDRGDVLSGASEGFQRMKKLAVVMAIISSKLGNRQFEYPLIADAPFSSFGQNFINNFFKVTPSVFKQSVVLIKDFYDTDSKNLISDDGNEILEKMKSGEVKGKFYVNMIPETGDTSELVTEIQCYN